MLVGLLAMYLALVIVFYFITIAIQRASYILAPKINMVRYKKELWKRTFVDHKVSGKYDTKLRLISSQSLCLFSWLGFTTQDLI